MNSEIATAFGIVVRKLRANAGVTQEQLGLDADLQRKYISSLELGEKAPSLETVLKVALGLHMEPAKLVALVCEQLQRQKNRP